MKVAICVGSNRPEMVVKLMKAWADQSIQAGWHIAWDKPKSEQPLIAGKMFGRCREEMDNRIIPFRTGAIRSQAFLDAYNWGADYIISLDDDVLPMDRYHIAELTRALNTPVTAEWVGIGPQKQRGIPYRLERTPSYLHMGGWWNNPDLDGNTRLIDGIHPIYDDPTRDLGHHVVPAGQFLALSAMHFIFRRELTPALYQLLMGDEYGFHRFDDIWSGMFAKLVCDHFGWPVTWGNPMVKHVQASDPHKNAEQEAAGIAEHEVTWRKIERLSVMLEMAEPDCAACAYRALAWGVHFWGGDYWPRLAVAMEDWANLFGCLTGRTNYRVGKVSVVEDLALQVAARTGGWRADQWEARRALG